MNAQLIASFVIAVVLEIGVPIAGAFWLHRKFHLSWHWWLYGVLTMLIFQGLTRLPIMVFVQAQKPVITALSNSPIFFLGFAFLAAFTAALFEEGGRWIVYRFFIPAQNRTSQTGLMLGAGHGGIESIIIGLFGILNLISYLTVMNLPTSALSHLAQQSAVLEQARQAFLTMPSWIPMISAWERLSTFVIHLGLSLMVLQSFRQRAYFWWYALIAHTVVDFLPIITLQYGAKIVGKNTSMLIAESILTIFAFISWILIQKWSNIQEISGTIKFEPKCGV